MNELPPQSTDIDIELFEGEMKALFEGCMDLHSEYASAPESEKEDLAKEINKRLHYLMFRLGHQTFVDADGLNDKTKIVDVMMKIINSDKWGQLEKTNGVKAIAFGSVVEADASMLDWSKTTSVEGLIERSREITRGK